MYLVKQNFGLCTWPSVMNQNTDVAALLYPYLTMLPISKRSCGNPHICPGNYLIKTLKLPDAFKDFAISHSKGRIPVDIFYTHCSRELLHAQWKILLDDEFMYAYNHGIVIDCCDGLKRRFYPRIFTYSADYQEKCICFPALILWF